MKRKLHGVGNKARLETQITISGLVGLLANGGRLITDLEMIKELEYVLTRQANTVREIRQEYEELNRG